VRAVAVAGPVATPTGAAKPAVLRTHVAAEVAAAAGLTDGEVGRTALLLVPLDAGQGRAYQRPVHGPVLGRHGLRLALVLSCCRPDRFPGHLCPRLRGNGLIASAGRFWYGVWNGGVGNPGNGHWDGQDGSGIRVGHAREDLLEQRGGGVFLLAASRDARSLVYVFRVACGAPRLFDVLFDHGDDGVVGHAPLARAVIIQCVTETQPALLH
jgi:hypothetical protein